MTTGIRALVPTDVTMDVVSISGAEWNSAKTMSILAELCRRMGSVAGDRGRTEFSASAWLARLRATHPAAMGARR